MKFLKWFIEDAASEENIRKEYSQLPDRKLLSLNVSELTPVGLKCYREEMARRDLANPIASKAEDKKD